VLLRTFEVGHPATGAGFGFQLDCAPVLQGQREVRQRSDLILFEASEVFTTGGGVLCPSGEAFTDFEHGGGNFVVAASFHLTKTLVCDDNTGTFTISVDAATMFAKGQANGGWSVVGGTGRYTGLHGGGNILGIYQGNDPLDIIDYYSGSVRL